jgi:phosphotransferase system HPr-like phosphotransfer protein
MALSGILGAVLLSCIVFQSKHRTQIRLSKESVTLSTKSDMYITATGLRISQGRKSKLSDEGLNEHNSIERLNRIMNDSVPENRRMLFDNMEVKTIDII